MKVFVLFWPCHMGFTICSLQYVGKNETLLNLIWSNHRKDLKDPSTVLGQKSGLISGNCLDKNIFII